MAKVCLLHRRKFVAYLQRDLSAIGRQQINCSPIEFVNITPPLGQTCGQYMNSYISRAGGYLTNPNSTSSCEFCSVRTTDELIGAGFDIFYAHRWRDFGLMVVFIMFNVRFSFKPFFLHELTFSITI